jgi:ankyrin repeat protein
MVEVQTYKVLDAKDAVSPSGLIKVESDGNDVLIYQKVGDVDALGVLADEHYQLEEFDKAVKFYKKCSELLAAGVRGKSDRDLRKIGEAIGAANQRTNEELDAVKSLVASGRDVNEKDEDGNAALWRAASKGQLVVAEFLVERGGANINILGGDDGITPLKAARSRDHAEVAEFLASKGAYVDLVDAAKRGKVEDLQMLIDMSRAYAVEKERRAIDNCES